MTYGTPNGALATIARATDPDNANREAVQIRGPNSAAVQEGIDTVMRTVDLAFGGVPGTADFIGPLWFGDPDNCWAATGIVVKFQTEQAA
ncbi:MAG: hypothetical protein Q7R45_08250 [Sulfuricaulis sp.]|nr:hypothetical protein [Sulfuricaulis sp.]